MSLDQYFEETISQIDSFTVGKSSLGKWNTISDTDAHEPGGFDCNICLDSVQDPVVTFCGHLFCWPCIYKWLNHFHSTPREDQEPQSPQCPVCKAEISQASLVPLYGRGQTTNPSKGKDHQIPRRPQGPAFGLNTQISSGHYPFHPPSSQFQDHPNPYQSETFNSVPSSYNAHFARPGVSMTNVFEPMIGVFGEMIYARVFDNAVTNVYTYPKTYNLSGISNPRIRRHVMQADVSLNRICFFLLSCILLCLLLF